MNAKQLGILGVLLALVVVVALVLKGKKDSTFQSESKAMGAKAFDLLVMTDVTMIELEEPAEGDGEAKKVTLEKKDGGWVIPDRDGYPANFEDISSLVETLYDLKVVEGQKVGASMHGRVGLVAPDGEGTGDELGTKVVLKGEGGKVLASLILGKKIEGAGGQPSPMGFSLGGTEGRFVRSESSTDEIWLVKESFASVNTDGKGWLNKDFISVSKMKSVTVDTGTPKDSWKIHREVEGGEIALADVAKGEEFDKAKAGGIGTVLGSASFQDVLPEAEKGKAGFDAGRKIEIETFEGFKYNLMIGNHIDPGNENSERYFTISSIEGNFPTERPKEAAEEKTEEPAAEGQTDEEKQKLEDEKKAKEEEEKKKDEEFKESLVTLQEKLEKEKAFVGKSYIVTKWSVSSLLKNRGELMKDEEPAEGAASPAAGLGSSKTIEAVTEPVKVEFPPR